MASPLPFPKVVQLEHRLWLAIRETGLATYDFPFESLFDSRHCFSLPIAGPAVLRIGALGAADAEAYTRLESLGLEPVNSLEEHRKAAELVNWYPLLEGLTPRSLWWPPREKPDAERIGQELGWPTFIRGSLHTRAHSRAFWRIESPSHLDDAWASWSADERLARQSLVARSFLDLRRTGDSFPDRIPAAFEFRSFWFKGECLAFGAYWPDVVPAYRASTTEREEALDIARLAAGRLGVPFAVIDVAQDTAGKWWVVECNDAQDCGMATIPPLEVWQGLLRRFA